MRRSVLLFLLFASVSLHALTQGILDCLSDDGVTVNGSVVSLCGSGLVEIEICNPDGGNVVLSYISGNLPYYYCSEYISIVDGGSTTTRTVCNYGSVPFSSYSSINSCITLKMYTDPNAACAFGYGAPMVFGLNFDIPAAEGEGCISYFATNYNPAGPQNSLACDYEDLQGLLLEGVSLDDLVASGVEDCDLIGLFAAGGIVVDVDRENKRALIGMAINTFMYDDDDDLTGSLRGDEFLDVAFSTELYGGAKNWDIIKRSYGTRYGTSTSSSTSGMPIVQSLGLVNVLGYYDWFVPNQAELQLYYDLYFSLGTQSLSWPVDPNGGSASLSMYFPANTVTTYTWTSDILNYGASATAIYREISGYGPGLSYEGTSSGSSGEQVIPMRIEYLDPPATVSNCSDWQYGDAGNQALSIGVPCLYPLFQCDSTESALWDELVIGAYPANTTVVEFGRDDTRDVLLNVPSTHEIDNNIYDVVGYEITSVSNVPVGLDVNLAPDDVIVGGDVHCLEFTGTAMQEGIYDINVVGVLYLNILGSVLTTDITMTHQVVVTPNVTGIEGCAYPSADNYDPLATIDIGNCLFDGLCPGDFDNDGLIGILDILHILGLYDTTCE